MSQFVANVPMLFQRVTQARWFNIVALGKKGRICVRLGPYRSVIWMRSRAPELVIGDPHDQTGLVDHIPEGVGPVQIVNFYHYHLWPEGKAYCAKCGARRHRDGFTIELDDGSFALAGSTCGADLWGERWTAVRRTFQEKLHKAGIILDVSEVLSELEAIRATLETKWRPVVEQIHAHQKRFKGTMSRLYKELYDAAVNSNHSLTVEGEAMPIDGWAFFAIDDVRQRFNMALSQIDTAIAAGHGEETELGVRTVNIGAAREQLDAIAHAARGLRSFFTQDPRHLDAIVRSINVLVRGPGAREDSFFRPHPYATGVRSLVDVFAERSIGLPDDYPVLDIQPLRKLCDLR